jgi:hypothetical protein
MVLPLICGRMRCPDMAARSPLRKQRRRAEQRMPRFVDTKRTLCLPTRAEARASICEDASTAVRSAV